MRRKRTPMEVWRCSVMDQTKAVENSSHWKDEETHWLLSVWKYSSKIPGQVLPLLPLSFAMT